MNWVYQVDDLDFVHCVVGFCRMCRDLLKCNLVPWNSCSDFGPIGFIRFVLKDFLQNCFGFCGLYRMDCAI
jgi:hypothetical protein